MAITKVWIDEGCTACRVCEDTCPNVFAVDDVTCKIKDGADFNANETCIKESADTCPVSVIKFE